MIPARSSSAAAEPIFLKRIGAYRERIAVFRRLFDEGVPARTAKDAIDTLAKEGSVVCPIPRDTDFATLARDLRTLDVEVSRRRSVNDPAAFIADVRARHHLSQRDFADRLGLDVRTLQNWEQGRNRPDDAVLALVRLFDDDPSRVAHAVFETGD